MPAVNRRRANYAAAQRQKECTMRSMSTEALFVRLNGLQHQAMLKLSELAHDDTPEGREELETIRQEWLTTSIEIDGRQPIDMTPRQTIADDVFMPKPRSKSLTKRFVLGDVVRTADGHIGEVVSYGYGIALSEPEYGVRCWNVDNTVDYYGQSTLTAH